MRSRFFTLLATFLIASPAMADTIMPVWQNDNITNSLSFNDSFGHQVVVGTYSPSTGTWSGAIGSVSVGAMFTGGLIGISGSPVTGTGVLGFTVAGMSGGIPYFSSASAWASSATLVANRIVLGGGAGVAPATLGSLGTITQVLHGNASGAPSFGAIVSADVSTALASPSPIGSTTPNTVAATTLSASGAVSGAGFSTYLASPPAIGGTVPAPGTFTNLSGTATTSTFAINTFGSGNDAVAGHKIASTDSGALTATARYALWVGNNSNGTGDGSVAGSTYGLAVSALKNNWTTTTVLGQTIGLDIAVRGGHNNALNSGDTAAINVNAGGSFSNNFVNQFEGISGYFPAGSTTNSLVINTQIGSIRSTGLDIVGNTGIGFYAQAQNGILGYAVQVSNLGTNGTALYGTASKWAGAFKYIWDDGTHTPYTAFLVDQNGQLTLAGFGAANTNQKTIRVGGAATNNLEILNAAGSAVIINAMDSGALTVEANTAITAGGITGMGYKLSTTANFGIFFGSGLPTLSAAKGSLYLRSDGSSTSTRAYINTDGATTWTAITTAL